MQLLKILLQILYTNRRYIHMHGNAYCTWVSLQVCHTYEKLHCILLYSYIILYSYRHLPYLHMALFRLFLLCWSCLTWTTWRASPCSQFSTFLKDLLAKRNLCTAASRASGLAIKWYWLHYNEAQGTVFCFCGIPYVLMVTF